jgi:hypothetical protein
MKKLLVVLLFLPILGFGQCLDTLNFPNLNPGTACNPEFIPVCGCDGVTYRNLCHAQYATVLQWVDGPCEQVAIDIYPNPVANWLYLTVATKFEANVDIYIFDRNGNIMYSQFLRSVTNQYLTIPTNDLEKGLYFVGAESNGVVQLLKFIRWEGNF